jgi:hypothetical protein
MAVNGIGVALIGCVMWTRSNSRNTPGSDRGLQVLPTAGPIRTFVQDDECFRRMAEPFIVFPFAGPRDRHC